MPFELLSSGSKENQKDLVGIFSDFGRGLKKLFPKKREKPSAAVEKTKNLLALLRADRDSHELTFGVVYANEAAKDEIQKESPQFPTGSIIVREKLSAENAAVPETVIAMVKRAKGFSPETGDWEFFVLDGADLKMRSRETKGDCAACHSRAEKTDWIFRDYLK